MWWERISDLGLAAVSVADTEADQELAALLLKRHRAGLYPPFCHPDPQMRIDPRNFWPAAKTIVSVAVPYPFQEQDCPSSGFFGLVARSMRGRDYHGLVKEKLTKLAALLAAEGIGCFQWQAWVDSVPPVERALARRAGLGFYGKNCSLIIPEWGSWFWLGELALDCILPPGQRPPPGDIAPGCGSCQLCLDACPTGALRAPYELDPYRCLSFLTQNKNPIPREYRQVLGTRLFGCDICQEVCPYNYLIKNNNQSQAGFPAWIPLEPLVLPGSQDFLEGTCLAWRKGTVLARNAAVALGNIGLPEAVAVLKRTLGHYDPQVRAHAAWALGNIGIPEAFYTLDMAKDRETDITVRGEILQALSLGR